MRITGRALRVWHPGMISIEEKNVYRMGNNQVGVLQGVPLTIGDDLDILGTWK